MILVLEKVLDIFPKNSAWTMKNRSPRFHHFLEVTSLLYHFFIFSFQRHSGGKKLLYGASEVMNASQFLKQVSLSVDYIRDNFRKLLINFPQQISFTSQRAVSEIRYRVCQEVFKCTLRLQLFAGLECCNFGNCVLWDFAKIWLQIE